MAKLSNKEIDIQLVRQIKQGDDSAFEAIVKKYKKTLLYTILNIVKDENIAEDITLETFMKVFININNYNEEYSFSTWIFTIATNLAIDYTRTKKHIRFKTHDNDSDGNPGGVYMETIENKSIESPETSLIKDNKRNILLKLINKLRPDYKKIIELRYFDEMSYKEIAKELEIDISVVKTKLHRAKKQLKNIIKDFDKDF